MGREGTRLILAVQLLTRIPTPPTDAPSPDWLARSAKYLPLVGAGVGALGAAGLVAARALWPAGPLPALLAVAAAVVVTGALHEDGLADVADAVAGRSREQRLAILKDPRLGAYGALALGLTLAIKVAALDVLPTLPAAAGLVAAHAGGRAAAALAMSSLPYAGSAETAKVASPERRMRLGERIAALALGCAPLLLLPSPVAALACAGLAALASAGVARACTSRIGGHTGDVLGAVEQAYELVFLLALAALKHPAR